MSYQNSGWICSILLKINAIETSPFINVQPGSNVCILLTERTEHVVTRLDTSLTDRRASLSRPLAIDLSAEKRISVLFKTSRPRPYVASSLEALVDHHIHIIFTFYFEILFQSKSNCSFTMLSSFLFNRLMAPFAKPGLGRWRLLFPPPAPCLYRFLFLRILWIPRVVYVFRACAFTLDAHV